MDKHIARIDTWNHAYKSVAKIPPREIGLPAVAFAVTQGPVKYWLIKQEPSSYSWDDFVADKKTAWTGVRNFQARNNLKAMKKGDRAFYYHSGEGKKIVGIAEIVKEAYPDPTATEGDWVCVDVAAVKPLKRAVSLAEIKTEKSLAGMVLLRNSRLSVQPVAAAEFEKIISVAQSKKPV